MYIPNVSVTSLITKVRNWRQGPPAEFADDIVNELRQMYLSKILSLKNEAKKYIAELDVHGVDATSILDIFVDERVLEAQELMKEKK